MPYLFRKKIRWYYRLLYKLFRERERERARGGGGGGGRKRETERRIETETERETWAGRRSWGWGGGGEFNRSVLSWMLNTQCSIIRVDLYYTT